LNTISEIKPVIPMRVHCPLGTSSRPPLPLSTCHCRNTTFSNQEVRRPRAVTVCAVGILLPYSTSCTLQLSNAALGFEFVFRGEPSSSPPVKLNRGHGLGLATHAGSSHPQPDDQPPFIH